MSNLLSKYFLCIYYNKSKYYFGMWSSPKYFKCNYCVALKVSGTTYYLPLFYSKLYSETVRNVQLRFVINKIPYYMLFTRSSLVDYMNYDTLQISYSLYWNTSWTPRSCYIRFQLGIGEIQRQALNYHINVSLIKSSGNTYYDSGKKIQPTYLENFYLNYTTTIEQKDGAVANDTKVFDNSFKNYESYEECGETYDEARMPWSETIRITCDACDGYIDIPLDYEFDGNKSLTVKIPIREGGTWNTES